MTHATGKVIAYQEAPTVILLTEDGVRVHWSAELTKLEEETVANSRTMAAKHHARHKDMDGSTCLLDACALHYLGGRQ